LQVSSYKFTEGKDGFDKSNPYALVGIIIKIDSHFHANGRGGRGNDPGEASLHGAIIQNIQV